jgi:hypothetical protein
MIATVILPFLGSKWGPLLKLKSKEFHALFCSLNHFRCDIVNIKGFNHVMLGLNM